MCHRCDRRTFAFAEGIQYGALSPVGLPSALFLVISRLRLSIHRAAEIFCPWMSRLLERLSTFDLKPAPQSLIGRENLRRTLSDSIPHRSRIGSARSREAFCPAR